MAKITDDTFQEYINALHKLERTIITQDADCAALLVKMQQEIEVYGEATQSSERKLMKMKTRLINQHLKKGTVNVRGN